ncbi:hypothetical protein, partial [Mitsuaria sp. TWR114]|uniref:hypothetical protein n=1 Tax=Mitsuaria sp. TWR114 TaxID=2601731 RepID=UPI003857907B
MVFIFSCLRQKRVSAPAQAQLHRLALGHLAGVAPEHPGHHALDVFQLQLLRLLDPHRALDPDRVQMQEAHAVEFAQRRLDPLGLPAALVVLRVPVLAHGCRSH